MNAKAALFAIDEHFEQQGRRLPIMISGTITDQSGRTLTGQTTEAFWNSVAHARPVCVGLNCALGAKELRPYVKDLSACAPAFVSVHPNAGLPNEFGQYDDTPEHMAGLIREFAESGFLNIVGGCCGTTPRTSTRSPRLCATCGRGRSPSSPLLPLERSRAARDHPGHQLRQHR